ncbi:hypothetical protein Tco_1333593 [Tanacetum coccineum]
MQAKDHNDSSISQMNKKSIENDDLKAQLQEKVFAIVALKNELRKLKGNSVDIKFAKPSVLGKPILQPLRKQPVKFLALQSLFYPLFDEYFNGENQVVSKSFAVTTADASDKRQQQPNSTSSTSTLATTVTANENFDL